MVEGLNAFFSGITPKWMPGLSSRPVCIMKFSDLLTHAGANDEKQLINALGIYQNNAAAVFEIKQKDFVPETGNCDYWVEFRLK